MEEINTAQDITPKNSNTILLAAGGVLTLLVIAGVVMFASKSANTSQSEPALANEMNESTAMNRSVEGAETTQPAEGVRQIMIEAGGFYYKPNTITVKKGETVEIVMNSVDMMHDFNIDELRVKSEIIKSGEIGRVTFTADKVGTFEYYCGVGEHRKNGQVGKITVTE